MKLGVRGSIPILGFLICLLAPLPGLAEPCLARASRPVRARGAALGPMVVSVRDCGAKGDGIADDSGAIQAALQALPPAGGKVVVPAGIYLLGSSQGSVLSLPEGTSIPSALVLQGENLVLEGAGSQSVLKLMAGRKLRMLTIPAAGAVVQDLVLDGNAAERATPAGNAVDALVVVTGRNARLRNCEVRNGLEDGVRAWQAGELNIENCSVHDNGGAGVVLAGGTGARVVGNRVERNRQGLWTAWGARDVFLGNNVIRGNQGAGILIGGPVALAGSGLISGITIAANLVEMNGRDGSPGIAIAGAQNGIIQSNTVINNLRAGIQLLEEPNNSQTANNRNWLLENNLCSNTTAARTQSEGIAILGRAENVRLQGNQCENNGKDAVSQVVVPNETTVNPDWASTNQTSFTPPGTSPPERAEDGQRLVVRGVVKTGRELGISHCQDGAYLQHSNGPLQIRTRTAAGATANLDLSYAGKTVSVTGAFQTPKCEALLCVCDDFLLSDSVFVESAP